MPTARQRPVAGSFSPIRVILWIALGCIWGAGEIEARGREGYAPLEVERADFRRLRTWQRHEGRSLRVELSGAGAPETLELTAASVRATRFRVSAIDAAGHRRDVEPPAPRTYRGRVEGAAGSAAAVTWRDGRIKGMIRMPDGRLRGVEPAGDQGHVVYALDDLEPITASCGVAGAGGMIDGPSLEETAGTESPTGGVVMLADIAFDADAEFLAANGGVIAETVADIEDIVNGLNVIYERDLGIRYRITEILVREGGGDPYTSNDPSTLLSDFRAHWNAHHADIPRDIAHLMTGRELDGSVIGIAFTGTICWSSYGYGLSQSRFSSNYARRVGLTAHELGHNWNADHCDAAGACDIMCSWLGGCGGTLSRFEASSVHDICAYRESRSCLAIAPGPPAPGDDLAWVRRDTQVEIDVLANDVDPNGDPLDLLSVSPAGHGSAFIDVEDRVVYLPDPGYVGDDPLTYEVTDHTDGVSTGTVYITVYDPDHPDHRWPFDEGCGLTAADCSGGADGVVTNADQRVWVAGTSGCAVSLDGIDDYVVIPAGGLSALGGTATLAFWIRTTQTGSDHAASAPGVAGIEPAGGNDEIRWGYLDGAGRIALQVGQHPPARSDAPVNDGGWHHVVLTRDQLSGEAAVYVDGVMRSQVAGPPGPAPAVFGSLGRIEDAGGTPIHLQAALDDICLFQRVAPADEIAALYATAIQPDLDGDGIADWMDEDDDNDGMSDEQELIAGTDATDARSRLEVAIYPPPAAAPVMVFQAVAGRRYHLEQRLPPVGAAWTAAGDPVLGEGTEIQLPLPAAPGCYRLSVERLP